ncbi:Stk1 family PASTA domain-containing Ser/Thr kinase [Phaeacidiphilus oryzae]|uniref:Stk1 family PASTA domain-containing Ser/Thr kinase n=1 Tax=Phaeacidiphilus oryzae TaxID=348818 RepID=UPI00056D2001|nr:Stk1 family PASTA domain-containing Ser/Thr kinase [Phaeacidiphilus oryzae]
MDTTLQDPLIGRELDGRYRVDERLAVGGMATVYRGVDTRLDRTVALKVMHPALAADPEFTDRFIREAKAVARLAHPNVVNVFDQGADGQAVFLAMEYVPGCTLRDLLNDRGALNPRTALDILEPVLAALGAAHRAGLVHRDVKPENVLLTHGGLVKVADFGLVRAVTGEAGSTSTGQVLGTVSYLAPEQIQQGEADPRTDVYAAGVLLYEMLTGGKPYPGGTPVQVIYRKLEEDAPPPSAAVPGLAPQLDALTAAAAAREPGRRPADAAELLVLLRRCRAGLTPDQLDAEPPESSRPVRRDEPTAMLGGRRKRRQRTERPAGPAARSGTEPTSVLAAAARSGTEPTSVLADLPADLVMPRRGQFGESEPTTRQPVPARPAPRRRRPRRAALWTAAGALVAVLVGGLTWTLNGALYTTMPGVLSLSASAAEQKLHQDGLSTRVTRAYSETVTRGDVISTDPGPGSRISKDGTVTLLVSQGPERHVMPDVTGRTLAAARQAITAAKLAVGTTTQQYSATVPKGSVVSTQPAAGQSLKPGTPVALTLSQGPQPVPLPQVTGLPVDQAQQQLSAAGFTVQVSPEQVYSDTVQAGQVAQESPAGGTAPQGSTVTLTLSKGPQLFPVPDVTGQTADQATAALQAAGFQVSVVNLNPLAGNPAVHSESPGGGTQQPHNTKITLLTY